MKIIGLKVWVTRQEPGRRSLVFLRNDTHVGITGLYKISALSESLYVRVGPHDAERPINILAGAHTMMTVLIFFKLAVNPVSLNTLNSMIDEPLNIYDGKIQLPTRPGLGINLDEEFIEAHLDNDRK